MRGCRVAESAVICAVCHRSNVPGNHSDAGNVFICVRCQADAAQFIAIQDPTWTPTRPPRPDATATRGVNNTGRRTER